MLFVCLFQKIEGADRETALREDPTQPYQPNTREIEPQALSKKTLKFQGKWFKDFPWLHYDCRLKGVLCFHCMQTFDDDNAAFGGKVDPAFVSVGFRNWKKGVDKFKAHATSHSHCHAVSVSLQKGIDAELSSALQKQQENNRHCLLEVVGMIKVLARQGIALRGHDKEGSNLYQMLKSRAETDPILSNWLEKRNHDYISPQAQNEVLQILGNTVVRDIIAAVKAPQVVQFSLIIDGTRDVSGKEQESICIRYVDHDLVPQEEFVGLYQASSTTGESICNIAIDILKRLNLPLSSLRGQAYDGAANMAGKNRGVQALIKQQQPLALYVHCGAHCSNLATEAACKSSPLIRDSLQWVHEAGTLFNMSGKFMTIFENAAKSGPGQYRTLKPLCPTRWTVRHKAITSVIEQYPAVLESLEQMATGTGEAATKANGLHDRFSAGTTVLGLLLASELTGELECLNRSLQMRTQTVGGMRKAVDCVRSTLQMKRDERAFQELFSKAEDMVTTLELRKIQVPRLRKPPQRLGGAANMHIPDTAVEYYRAQYFSMLDTVNAQLEDRFNQESMDVIQKLEEVLLTGVADDPVVAQYPELNMESLKVELCMFRAKYTYKSCEEAANILQKAPVQVRSLFREVETLIRLLLVIPASSCEAERSFSALRRLKTWLRSTMGDNRLNHVAVCHVHKHILDSVVRKKICQEFISVNDRRRKVFGKF